jgi:hypothetical protein
MWRDSSFVLKKESFMGLSLCLILSPSTAELQGCTPNGVADGEVLGRMAMGHATMENLFFKQNTLDAAALERAIEWTEDRIQEAKIHVPPEARLSSYDSDVLELARVSGVTGAADPVLHVDAVEQTFSRLVMQSMGQSATQESLPATARFFATVVFVRELMHHLRFPQIRLLDTPK